MNTTDLKGKSLGGVLGGVAAGITVGCMYVFLKCTEACTGKKLPCNPEDSKTKPVRDRNYSKCAKLCFGYFKLCFASGNPFGSIAQAAGGGFGKMFNGQ